jgi:hypothetical protein
MKRRYLIYDGTRISEFNNVEVEKNSIIDSRLKVKNSGDATIVDMNVSGNNFAMSSDNLSLMYEDTLIAAIRIIEKNNIESGFSGFDININMVVNAMNHIKEYPGKMIIYFKKNADFIKNCFIFESSFFG